jgi:integrase
MASAVKVKLGFTLANDHSDLAFETHGGTPCNRCSRMPLWCLPSQVSLAFRLLAYRIPYSRCARTWARLGGPGEVRIGLPAGTRELAAPSVKQRLAAIRHLFDWLVTSQVVPVNPAASVRGPRHVVTSGQTPVLDPSEARALLDSIDTSTVVGLRDRALMGLMVYSFARIGAALGMTVEDVFTQNAAAPDLWTAG